MWQNAKRGAMALMQRGWREGEDVAFLQVHNLPHGWEAAKTELRDMLHFLLRKSPPRLLPSQSVRWLNRKMGPAARSYCFPIKELIFSYW